MNNRFYVGLVISIFNLVFYAAALDLLFQSGIYSMLFDLDLVKKLGSTSTIVGVGCLIIAIIVEVIGFKVIRRGTVLTDQNNSTRK
ncbi:hypothetical protein [Shimazuella kribbensis]|uniref:hypothetical protein n=1 Tax=Shimazuella kribbensis TaxID=139808 RepID=UPI000417BC3B|nr:hypothetical protein [Shimazuella kribbensis]